MLGQIKNKKSNNNKKTKNKLKIKIDSHSKTIKDNNVLFFIYFINVIN